MSYYIHAGKFFLENRTENGGYLEIQDDGNFGSVSYTHLTLPTNCT